MHYLSQIECLAELGWTITELMGLEWGSTVFASLAPTHMHVFLPFQWFQGSQQHTCSFFCRVQYADVQLVMQT